MYTKVNIPYKYPDSVLAHKYLDGLRGIEIGASKHNPFNLNTLNVDLYNNHWAEYSEEYEVVDIVSAGDNLPFKDNSFDFVISSHVLEHFFDPTKTLKEWARVSKKFIFLILPHRDRCEDRHRELTSPQELAARHDGTFITEDMYENKHHNVWDLPSFIKFVEGIGYEVIESLDPDDKVSNGFCVILDMQGL
jgi:SAM-dependent methyltransferase